MQPSPSKATRHKKRVPKIPVPIVPPPSIQQPSTLEWNIRPPSRPSNLLPTSIHTCFQLPPTRLNPTKSVRSNPSKKPIPKIPPSLLSRRPPSNNRPLWNATSGHPHVRRTCFRLPFRTVSSLRPPTRLNLTKSVQSNPSLKNRPQNARLNSPAPRHPTTVKFRMQHPFTLTSVEPPSDLHSNLFPVFTHQAQCNQVRPKQPVIKNTSPKSPSLLSRRPPTVIQEQFVKLSTVGQFPSTHRPTASNILLALASAMCSQHPIPGIRTTCPHTAQSNHVRHKNPRPRKICVRKKSFCTVVQNRSDRSPTSFPHPSILRLTCSQPPFTNFRPTHRMSNAPNLFRHNKPVHKNLGPRTFCSKNRLSTVV
jgi:hypothetical protein